MAGRFEYTLATEADDRELRELLRETAMPGNITLAFLREPSFFLAEQAGSRASQVLICRDRTLGRLVGMGSRSFRSVYIEGNPTIVGYLSMLRGSSQARGNIGLARGYQYLRKLHADGAVPYYFTTILDENTEAMRLLTSGRSGLPVYQLAARLVTYLVPLTRKPREHKASAAVSKVSQDTLPQAVAFLQEWNSCYQFAPVYTLQDMLGQSTLLPGFSWEDLYIYRRGGKVLGTLGVWDQQAFKQTTVTSYSRGMVAARPLYNLYASLRGIPRLPRAGEKIKLLYAAFTSGEKSVFAELLSQACDDWSGCGYDYLSLGFCDDHACSYVAANAAAQRLASTLYIVYWAENDVLLPQLKRPAHPEIATL